MKVPEEIVYEILLRLPVKSLLRFTTVCKSWNCMIKSSTFIHTHLESNHRNDDVQLLLHHPELDLYSLYRDEDNKDDGRACASSSSSSSSSTRIEYSTDLDSPYAFYAERTGTKSWGCEFVGTCNGLVCLAGKDIDLTTLVWNPSIRKFVVLPKSGVTFCHEYDNREVISFAFGYDRRANDYKVLRRVSCFRGGPLVSCQYEIWSLAKGSWKTLINTANDRHQELEIGNRYFEVGHLAAFVNGALHWLQANVSTWNISIVSFDMSGEVFSKIAIPPKAETRNCLDFNRDCVVSRYRESLAFFESCREIRESGLVRRMNMWVMEEYGVAKSWTKLFAICLEGRICRLVGCSKSGEEVVLKLMVDDDIVEYKSVNTKTKQVKNFNFDGECSTYYTVMDAFTENLVLLDQPNLFTY
ncbi:F-box/kelch-repeat protein [Prunus yedoensis var. nudiflora]|uniref:F-box/kelch-repeat protein n=1 Tax=Prunus yedoensis var. nudiflora TaxID=2094558 RepID=A0A314ZRX6_PRUYE|nr:F-box/kelch-repeat protein [Prunus yedoensis var. nudiflora]